MPVPGSQVVGYRPFSGTEQRLYRAKPDVETRERKWPPAASVLFIAAASLALWVAIGFTLRAIF